MHNMAIALHKAGHQITGSDDVIYDPAKSRLEKYGLLPTETGWDPERITPDLDAIILGMHAKPDNPELLKAQALGLPVYSFPEYVYKQSQNKHRVAIAGSHGKTTITSMVMHVLRSLGRDFDYLVGAQLEGFETMVRLTADAPLLVVEGDEYLASPIDRRPKVLLYQPHIALISGIAWDHINVFPTEENYDHQFELLIQAMPKAGSIVYFEPDKKLKKMVKKWAKPDEQYLCPYQVPGYSLKDGQYEIKLEGKKARLQVIGKHNLANIAGAWKVCEQLAVSVEEFLTHIATFTGAAKRLEKFHQDENNLIFRDFAHSPSKVKATVEGVQEMYGKQNVIACLELHTFSSLNKEFIDQYQHTLKAVKQKVIYIDQATLQRKGYPPISKEELVQAFGDPEIEYAQTQEALKTILNGMKGKENVWLMMSSGNFGGIDLMELTLGKE